MEEDIKILEQFLIGNKYCEDCKEKCVDCYIEYEEVQAVANLIKGYREEEKENNALKRLKINDIESKYIEGKRNQDNYWKSKITEKISELVVEEETGYFDNRRIIRILQELMEDK